MIVCQPAPATSGSTSTLGSINAKCQDDGSHAEDGCLDSNQHPDHLQEGPGPGTVGGLPGDVPGQATDDSDEPDHLQEGPDVDGQEGLAPPDDHADLASITICAYCTRLGQERDDF